MSLLQFHVGTGERSKCVDDVLDRGCLYHTPYFHPLFDIDNKYMGFTTVGDIYSLERIKSELGEFIDGGV